jgi:Ca2+-binding RTX toxin-like protein
VFWEIDLASASCWAEMQLWDISDPTTPDFLRRARSPEFIDTLFHSTTFSWDAQFMALEDEAGGGGDDRCRDVNDMQGRILFYDQSANLHGTFKIPRPQPKGENCTAHLYNYVPQTNGRDIIVSAWYQGGTSVIDATNPTAAKEIAYYDANSPTTGGTANVKSDVWASYWYNGYIYANDILRGLDVFQLTDSRVNAAVTFQFFNPQTQMNLIPQVAPSCRGQAATVMGTSGADTLTGTAGPDVIVGLGGADTLSGLGGDDRLCGGAGKDGIKGGAGADRMSGNKGRDRLSGGTGNDKLNGGPGFDRCAGGAGVDALTRCEVIIG